MAGVTQPGGAGTKICIYDDASSASGTGYTMAEISAAFPAVIVDLGTNRKAYRCIQDIQIGDLTTDAATTTLADTNVDIFFDSGKSLRTRTTQLTSWYLRLGTKVGTGDQASGKDGCTLVLGSAGTGAGWVRQAYCYGCTLRTTTGSFLQSQTDGYGEYINCILQSSATGTTPFSLGTVGFAFDNLYNIDISHVTTAQVMSNFNANTAERITIACAAPTTFLSTNGVAVAMKDVAFFGSPTQSDLRWGGTGAINWVLVRPLWTGNAPKFSMNGASSLAIGSATVEYRIFDTKLVDANGDGIADIPFRLTDAYGNVQIDTTTNAHGQITFGSGLTTNAVACIDHYTPSAGTYGIRDRSPFYTEINTGVGMNPAYESKAYYWNWPGSETYTTTSGALSDVGDVIYLAPAVVAPIMVDDLPLEASGEVRILMPVPEVA